MNNEENIDKLDESVEKIKENMKNIQSEEFQLKKVEIKETDYYNVSFMDFNDGQKGGDKGYNKKIEKELLEEIKKNKEKTFSEFVEENIEKKAKSKGLIGKKTYSCLSLKPENVRTKVNIVLILILIVKMLS